jgi:5-formyltetrahydrofolate cyclo-ligase
MMNIKEQKKALRQQMFLERSKIEPLHKAKYDQFIGEQLVSLILKNGYKVVHAYIPMGQEIDIAPLLQELLHKKITVVCPKTLPARALENRVLTSLNDLETGIKGTQHPALPQVYEGSYDLIIVPGLAFDHQKYRLGYGGGYYDGFLATQPQAHKVGIFYPFQQVDEVPREAHDVFLDEILLGRY